MKKFLLAVLLAVFVCTAFTGVSVASNTAVIENDPIDSTYCPVSMTTDCMDIYSVVCAGTTPYCIGPYLYHGVIHPNAMYDMEWGGLYWIWYGCFMEGEYNTNACPQ